MTVIPSVVFICTANVCRSVMAEAIFTAEAARRSLCVTASSGGITDCAGADPAEAAWLTCLQNGTPIENFGATYARNIDFAHVARVFIMEPFHREALIELHPDISAAISMLGEFDPDQDDPTIEDPMNQGIAAFEGCYRRIRNCISKYLDTTGDFSTKA